jgi:hypothetical protein
MMRSSLLSYFAVTVVIVLTPITLTESRTARDCLGKASCEASGGKDAPLRRPKGATNGRRLLDRLSDAMQPFDPVGNYESIVLGRKQPSLLGWIAVQGIMVSDKVSPTYGKQ